MTGGSLYNYLKGVNKKDGKSSLIYRTIKDFTEQILNGLCYIHSKDIIHRDIRSHNILRTTDNLLKIADFGLSKDIGKGDEDIANIIDDSKFKQSFASLEKLTPFWQPPERILSLDYSSSDRKNVKYDIWMFGVVLLELTCTEPPHFVYPSSDYTCMIITQKYIPEIPDFVDTRLRDIIKKCLKYKIDERPSSAELLETVRG